MIQIFPPPTTSFLAKLEENSASGNIHVVARLRCRLLPRPLLWLLKILLTALRMQLDLAAEARPVRGLDWAYQRSAN